MSTHTERIERVEPLPVGRKSLWMGVLLAPAAWILTEAVGYYMAARSCEAIRGLPLAGPRYPMLAQAALGIGALIVAGIGLAIAISNLRRVNGRPVGTEATALGRARFMAYGGVLVSVMFLGGIVMFVLPALIVNACSQAH